MEQINPLSKNKVFEHKTTKQQKVIVFADETNYYNRLTSFLINKSLDAFYFSDEFDQVCYEMLRIKASFIILAFHKARNNLITLIQLLREHSPYTQLIVQASVEHASNDRIEQLNISGVISEGAEFTEILECFKKITAGYRFLGKGIKHENAFPIEELPMLTNQEHRVLQLLHEGITGNQSIADKLYVSPHTVKNHKGNLMKKFNVSSIQDLYFLARQIYCSKKDIQN